MDESAKILFSGEGDKVFLNKQQKEQKRAIYFFGERERGNITAINGRVI